MIPASFFSQANNFTDSKTDLMRVTFPPRANAVRYRLWCLFRSHQWPLRDGDHVEVRKDDMSIVARIPVALLEAMVAHHLDGIAMQAYLAQSLLEMPPQRFDLPPRSEAKQAIGDADVRAKFRATRKRRTKP